MSADIVAIGPFHPRLIQHLEYSPEQYATTRIDSPVVATLFEISRGSSASRTFASHLGISDPWDFNQHKIDAAKIDIEGLRAFLTQLADGADFLPDLDALVAFRDAGFDLYFRPNG